MEWRERIVKCLNCGNENKAEAKFCTSCGKALQIEQGTKKVTEIDDGKTKSIAAILLIGVSFVLQYNLFDEFELESFKMAVLGDSSALIQVILIFVLLLIGMFMGFLGEQKSKEVYGVRTTLAAIAYVMATIASIVLVVYLVIILLIVIVTLVLVKNYSEMNNMMNNLKVIN